MKDLDYYLSLPYTFEIAPDLDDGGWAIRVKELPHCVAHADEWGDIQAEIKANMVGWIEVALAHNLPIPEPEKLSL